MTGRSPQGRERRRHLADAARGIFHQTAPDYDAVQSLLAPAGECARCKKHADRLVTIALVQGNSGPGWSQEGCIPCARTLAGFMLAPAWLKKDIARLEAAGVTE